MGRSQRHKVFIQGTDSNGKGLSEKQPALRYVIQFAASQAFSVPAGPTGGPLQGSSVAGFPPTLIPLPTSDTRSDAELHAAGEFSDPGQFNLSGNPRYTSLPPADGSGGETDPDNPEPGMEPTLTSIDPTSAAIGDPDLTLTVTGTNFTDSSVIVFNGGDEATTFVSDTEVTTTVKPSTASTPGDYPVTVRQGGYAAMPLQTFTFTEAGAPARGRRGYKNDPAETREFPSGPIGITKIEKVGDELHIEVTSTDVQAGDFVRITATGRTDINGDYRVNATAGSVIHVVGGNIELWQAISDRGRLVIIAGGE